MGNTATHPTHAEPAPAGSPGWVEHPASGMPPDKAPKASAYLAALFWLAEFCPALLKRSKAVLARATWHGSGATRLALRLNAARLRPHATPAARDRLGRAILRHFIDVIANLGAAQAKTPKQIVEPIESIAGQAHYQAARSLGRGTIIVTAHLGVFEAGMALVGQREPRVFVVFARDLYPRFEAMRSRLRDRLGIQEARIEEGWPMWVRLRDALTQDAVVMMQGDRVMAGQKGQSTPFMGGHLGVPTGPVRLAQLSGSPILPVFAVQTAEGKVRVTIEAPITLDPQLDAAAAQHKALSELTATLEKHISQHPEQWLMLQPAWCEDQEAISP